MKYKVINEGPERTIALIFDKGDEVVSTLERFAGEQGLTASRFSAIGALQSAVLGYFDWESKEYDRIPVEQQVEVLRSTAMSRSMAISPGCTRMPSSVAATAARWVVTCWKPGCGRRWKCCSSSPQATCARRAITKADSR